MPSNIAFFIITGLLLNCSTMTVARGDAADLHQAVRLDDLEAVTRYAADPVLINAPGDNARTPLMVAIRWGHRDIALLLIRSGAELNAVDADHRSALHHAAHGNERALMRALIEARANIDLPDAYHYTALHMAAREGHLEAVHLLLEAGADVNAQIDVGFTALDLAEQYPSVQDYLRQRGGKEFSELAGR